MERSRREAVADQVEQPVPVAASADHLYQGVAHQSRELGVQVDARQVTAPGQLLDLGQVDVPGEAGQAGQQAALLAGDQVQAPVHARRQPLLVGQASHHGHAQHVRIQPLQQDVGRDGAEPADRPLDRQRQSIQALAQGRHHILLVRQVEAGALFCGPAHEQLCRRGCRQRQHLVHVLAGHTERPPGSHDHVQVRASEQQVLRHACDSPGHVLRGIDHEQYLPVGQHAGQRR